LPVHYNGLSQNWYYVTLVFNCGETVESAKIDPNVITNVLVFPKCET